MEKSKVYFTKKITPEQVVKLYEHLGKKLPGKVACKVHSGETGNQNFLHPEFWKPIIELLNGTCVECNTAYRGQRETTEKHLKTLEKHGWSKYFKVDLLDGEGPDLKLDIPNGIMIKEDYVGKNISKYDSAIVLSHFKGHPMGGFGGALKQLSIGFGSSKGKIHIHAAGKDKNMTMNMDELWENLPPQQEFLASMADAASAVHKYFAGNVVYINVMKNMSVDCDCCSVAEDPCIKDIGMLISLDPIAIDKACIDIVYNSKDPGRNHLIERIERQSGADIFKYAMQLDFGNTDYEIIDIDKK